MINSRVHNLKIKTIFAIVLSVCAILGVIVAGIVVKMSTQSFESDEEMFEVINGIWQTGNTESDFVIEIAGDTLKMRTNGENKSVEEHHITLFPKSGYFYVDNKKNVWYEIVMKNGRYAIKTDRLTYEKVE